MINREKNVSKQNVIDVMQSVLILSIVMLVVMMMIQIYDLQGTARVINYAGLVRGSTQREIKLEITGTQNDELIQYLDDIISGLRYQDGHYDLIRLKDEVYQEKLDVQSAYWEQLKEEIAVVRQKGYENTNIVAMSETYFEMADETVFAAEDYSQQIAEKIRTIELFSVIDILGLVTLVIIQMVDAMKMARISQALEKKAYIDAHTGLQNKSRCEEILNDTEVIRETTACMMFDLNNLKIVNDTKGHSAGDQLIFEFAKLLRKVIPEDDFVGRYGGDEFMAVIYDTNKQKIEEILEKLCSEIDQHNHNDNTDVISYAQGWALSNAYENCTMQLLFDRADCSMYENKQLFRKIERQAAREGEKDNGCPVCNHPQSYFEVHEEKY